MFKSTANFLVLALASTAFAQDAATKMGWSGMINSLDGGLEGTVMVVDEMTLEITDYVLKDAGAPALYWWGSTTQTLQDGFRISNEQVTETSDGSDLMIALDAGKTTADFSVVGLWCERLESNFGQATLMASAGGTATSGTASASASASAAATESASSAATHLMSSNHEIIAVFVAVAGLAFWM